MAWHDAEMSTGMGNRFAHWSESVQCMEWHADEPHLIVAVGKCVAAGCWTLVWRLL